MNRLSCMKVENKKNIWIKLKGKYKEVYKYESKESKNLNIIQNYELDNMPKYLASYRYCNEVNYRRRKKVYIKRTQKKLI